MNNKISIKELEKNGSILKIQDGNHGAKHPKAKDYVDSGIPFVMANDIKNYTVDLKNCKYISFEHSKSLRIGFALKDDVLLTHKGTIGETAIVPRCEPYVMLTPQVTYYRLNKKKLIPRYLVYAFSEPFFQKKLFLLSAQSTRPYIGITNQRILEISYSPIDKQKKIAAVLSTYDKLIENNTRRIEILEEMAQRIYKEWFVDFKYPGHENDELVDSELGMIPEGWEVGSVSDLYEVKSGFAFKSKKMQDSGDFGIVKIKNIQSTGIDLSQVQYILEEDVEPRAYNFELEENDLLIAMTGAQVGKVGLMPKTKEDYFLNQRVGKFFPLPHFKTNNTFLNQLSRSKYFQSSVVNIAQGAAQPNISGKQIADIQFPLPNLKMISEYEQLCESFKSQITNLNFANVNLKETRDYLLPKLISGKVDVSDLDIDTSILDD
tara:strand:+ start:304 stop:1605 length:1302 start_codon:yes stop_codon:yes gene_type:complete